MQNSELSLGSLLLMDISSSMLFSWLVDLVSESSLNYTGAYMPMYHLVDDLRGLLLSVCIELANSSSDGDELGICSPLCVWET